jgi:succinate dehydrogenase/fumarate reductase flavoprotein subunit
MLRLLTHSDSALIQPVFDACVDYALMQDGQPFSSTAAELEFEEVPSDFSTDAKRIFFAGRVADFIDLAELMARDTLQREESCGGHFREEHQTPDGEAQRDDDNFAVVSAWEYRGEGQVPQLHQEDLAFENVQLTQRSYK